MKRFMIAGIAGVSALVYPVSVEALSRTEFGSLAAGLRIPVGAIWLIAPMLLAVAGAVTLGWRRAATDGRSDTRDRP